MLHPCLEEASIEERGHVKIAVSLLHNPTVCSFSAVSYQSKKISVHW